MRVESQVSHQSMVESSKTHEKKEVTQKDSGGQPVSEESQPLTLSHFGTCGTYSINSLKAAVDYHVKFLSVAENNMKAIQHSGTIPQALIDHLNGHQMEA